MRNLNLFIAVILVAVFTLTSCQKDGMDSMTTEMKTTKLTRSVTDYTEENESNTKGNLYGIKTIEEQRNLPAIDALMNSENDLTASSRHNWNIRCGQSRENRSDAMGRSNYDVYMLNRCANFNSQYNPFSAFDVRYNLIVEELSNVEISLSGLSADLDIFLFENSQGGLGHCFGGSIETNNASESISLTLSAGEYYIIIDGYNEQQVSHYRLAVDCEPHDFCLISDDFESYPARSEITTVNPTDWKKIRRSAAYDGVVNRVRVYEGNKSLRLKWKNGYSMPDQAKVMAKLGVRTSGRYVMSFKMYVPEGKAATFILHKYQRRNDEAIIFNFTEYGGIEYQLQNTIAGIGSGQFDRDSWLDVQMFIDLDNGIGQLLIDDVELLEWEIGKYAYNDNLIVNSLGAIQFKASSPDSKFFIDDFCFENAWRVL